jgi:hypothetical protein
VRTDVSNHPQVSRNPPPACLLKENPNRLVTLWDIVNQFDCRELHIIVKNLNIIRDILDPKAEKSTAAFEEWVQEQSRLRGEKELSAEMRANLAELLTLKNEIAEHRRKPIQDVIAQTKKFCESHRLFDTLLVIRFAENHLRLDPSDVEIRSELRHIEEALYLDICKRKFLRIEPDIVGFLEQDELFGPEVNRAFPSTVRDIKESGNCLAADCGTGAVFHAMRGAEVCLRLLAKDRGLAYAHSSIENKQWGQLLGDLDGILRAMRLANGNLWPTQSIREKQIQFYHSALAEFRDFNEAWRKHVAHAHEGAFYDSRQAESVLNHVGTFMHVLSGKISETGTTPLYWLA